MSTENREACSPPSGRAAMKKGLPKQFQDYRNVWVFIELEHGQVHPVSIELLGEGRKLADKLGVHLAGVVIGPPGGQGTANAIADAFAYGADLSYLVESPLLAHYRNEPFTKALTDLVLANKPEILLLGATTLGRDLAGSVATTLKTGLTADCTELNVDSDGSLAATRPTFGGSLLCTIYTLKCRPQMATVRPSVMATPQRVNRPTGSIIRHDLKMLEEEIATKVLAFFSDCDSTIANLAYADVVVAGGLGLGAVQNLQLLKDLARTLGGDFGCSRPLVQKGWMPFDRQIGQTGNTIRPKLYIAAGISGAVQHRVGVEGSDLIVAINTDPNAPIFDFAHLGVVADAISFLPALTEVFTKRLEPRNLEKFVQ
ncbi:electron transfer flavoprotein subunit alpha/FixB family protein [Sinorhizobium meliloti]|nr:electron transfer flavoprotein subunit alpha/FixB family protein [Sinorhizobium meliloti]TWB25218.1 electron transfer flavoprotein alpha subunit apoprotein [Ensifer sp. SEMIA 135]ASP60468.1 electron transfer flavoprotein subunit alpha/FixB family protein [Sinorhizobium meliloti]ASP67231.1 electron transfer flavoprotein subunit alpha/FixB family protein [Sinorhizobium meliloti]ASP81249.1 electron transfer flavoprotein subunit alpha/FixB family protein [Sinorhizobium meliloti]MCK3803208.1 ele